jgi:hypothetical protein
VLAAIADINQRLSNLGLSIPDVLLPSSNVDLGKWAVIACDQFTQDASYWKSVEQIAGDDPSTLNIIFPEVYLKRGDRQERIQAIHRTMKAYLEGGVFADPRKACIYTERVTSNMRRGLVVNIDLERYEWKNPENALIRSTEQTVPDRLPPRMDVRRGAALESPHVLLLLNDKDDELLPALGEIAKQNAPLYNANLMLNSGSVTGWVLDNADTLAESLETLAQKNKTSFLFAVGDGNHSLAAAKEIWNEYKNASSACAVHAREAGLDTHPSRYAMVEIENLYDTGISFEPIHRLVFGASADQVQAALTLPNSIRRQIDSREELLRLVGEDTPKNRLGLVIGKESLLLEFENNGLAVAAVQPLLDAFAKESGCTMDYIHGEETVFRTAEEGRGTGILLPPIKKSDFFETIAKLGALPRKSFSMGEAEEKRFYLECRRLFV